MEKDIWLRDPHHNFCAILSGAIGFLNGNDAVPQEISIQLWRINPCCPGTKDALGDARTEKVSDVLQRVSTSPIFQKLDKGDPYSMGESIGVSREYADKRCAASWGMFAFGVTSFLRSIIILGRCGLVGRHWKNQLKFYIKIGEMITAYFTGIEQVLISNIKNTKSKLRIAVAWFTNPRLFACLDMLLDGGVKVELILADDILNFREQTFSFQKIINKGATIWYTKFPSLMHHKFCMMDERILISGSYNWTLAAENKNHENIIVTTELAVIKQFGVAYENLILKCERIVDVKECNFNSYLSGIEKQVEDELLRKTEVLIPQKTKKINVN